jgi:arylsulfatase A-like enzyme
VNNNLVMNIDIAETLLDAANVKIPSEMQGESLLPLLKGKRPANWRKGVYYHYYDSGGEHNVAKHVGIRTDRYKLIWFYENKEWELYDLLKDKDELHNVYNDSRYKKIREKLKQQLRQLEHQYKDTEMYDKT